MLVFDLRTLDGILLFHLDFYNDSVIVLFLDAFRLHCDTLLLLLLLLLVLYTTSMRLPQIVMRATDRE